MKHLAPLLAVPLLIALAGCATAGVLRNTFTFPNVEAGVAPADTCAGSTVPQTGPLTARRSWTGPQAGSDVLVGNPGASATMTANVPGGVYTVTVVVDDAAGNTSCPTVITQTVRGKPAKLQNLGDAMLKPRKLPELLAAMLEP